jgi:hypothetical protein
MTPKEKAEELIDKFTYWNTSSAEREGIKSALIAVDEIIKDRERLNDAFFYDGDYWVEVKKEIDKINNL